MTEKLKKWAAIDIETTGMDPGSDDIIDIGYYLFEGFEFKKKFSSLCKTEQKLSPFITQLTGIKNSDLAHAPKWSDIEDEIASDLAGATLLAHNSEFEKNFLSSKIPDVTFVDSLSLFPFLHLNSPSLSLESILKELKLSHKEEHRGLADARDMLRSLITHFLENGENLNRLYQVVGKLDSIHPDLDFFVRWGAWPKESLLLLKKSLDSEVLYPYEKSDDLEVAAIGSDLPGELSREYLLEYFAGNPSYQWLATKVAQSLIKKIHAGIQVPIEKKYVADVLIPILKKLPGSSVVIDLADERKNKDPHISSPMDSFCELKFQEWNSVKTINPADPEDQWINAFMNFLFMSSQKITTQSIPGVLFHRFSSLRKKMSAVTLGQSQCGGESCAFFERCGYAQNLKELKKETIIHASLESIIYWPIELPKYERLIILNADRLEESMTKIYTREIEWNPSNEEFEKTLQRLKSEPRYHYLYGIEKEKLEDKINNEVEYFTLNRDDEIKVKRTSHDISKKSWELFFSHPHVTTLLCSPFYGENIAQDHYLTWISGYSLINSPSHRYQKFQSHRFSNAPGVELENFYLDSSELTDFFKQLDLDFKGAIYYFSEYKKNKELLQSQVSELGSPKNEWKLLNENAKPMQQAQVPAMLVVGKIPDFSMKFVYQSRREWVKQNKIFANEFQDYFMAVRCLKLMQLMTQHSFARVVVIDDRIRQWKQATWGAWEKNLTMLE
ncbi:MAG: 3'-5' exonuclease [Bacteriovoracaceae bacterium]|nr:3'-5' exonuclease [Bacteriovoracaceae bacterium]